jgi:hypothetical protein
MLFSSFHFASIKKYLKISRSVPMEEASLLSSTTIRSDKRQKYTNEELDSFMNYLRRDGYLIFSINWT